MNVDLSPLWQAVIGLAAAALATFGSQALLAAKNRWNIQFSDAQVSAFDDALRKTITYEATQAQSLIASKGWDHVEVHDAVIANGLNTIVAKFPGALAGVGLSTDLSDPANRQAIQAALQRALPAAFTAAAASPATPPATAPVAPLATDNGAKP